MLHAGVDNNAGPCTTMHNMQKLELGKEQHCLFISNQIQVHTATPATLPAAAAVITPRLSLRRLSDPSKGIPKSFMVMVACDLRLS